MSQFNFGQLGPDLILDAIESLPIFVESGLLALNSYENRVYQFAATVNDKSTRLVVKFYRPQRWSDEQIQEEHQFAQELVSHDIPIVAPLTFDGQSLHHFEGYRFALYPSVGGRQFEVDNLDQLEWMGRFIGRMHNVAKANAFRFRPSVTLAQYIDEPIQALANSELVPLQLHDAFFSVLEHVAKETKARFTSVPSIRLHGDCHPGNILWRDGPSFVDLDDCRMGPAIQDIWMMLSGERSNQLLQLDTIAEAYEEFATFPTEQLPLIEPLRAMRMIHYMAWLEKRWSDPAFPQAFPWFADNKYWEQQILALKEQLAALNEPALKLGY
ncbi:serine/threonine protein kinase [Aestuariibacter sp. AA17]|uniref:Stress response kinase A n=1 Tax=Fluctibacter corallii TaxID=2984329 RepID=A0ABT3A7X0_9ALTE|nr:serine/threonine protein kinase [Aestuariibacter sp. AA17]MCV2884778.1 serine/threonine protein kinase [Aestuariibacter sp. AA17]